MNTKQKLNKLKELAQEQIRSAKDPLEMRSALYDNDYIEALEYNYLLGRDLEFGITERVNFLYSEAI